MLYASFCLPSPVQGCPRRTGLQAQARLWEGLSSLSERLDVLHASLRELVVRRYRERDIAAVEAGHFGEAGYLPAIEEPEYQEQWQQNRYSSASVLRVVHVKHVC
jgi:hypothetical protein